MAGKFRLLRPGGHHIDNSTLGAYLEAAMWDVVHNDTMADEEKVAAIFVLAGLAVRIGDHWRSVNPYFSEHAERLWFRMAGLARDGMPRADLLGRIAEVEEALWGPDDEDDDYRPRHRRDDEEGVA